MEAVRAQLMSEYRETRGKLQLLPGIPEECAKMEDIFVDMILCESETQFGKMTFNPLQSHNDLISVPDNQGKIKKHILVKGNPGCGKSTLVSKIAYDWAKNENSTSPFAQFQLVFAIDLKEVVPGTDLMDIIQEQLLPKVSKRGLERYIESNAESVLFLFDGYDEVHRSFLEGSCRVFKGVLSSQIFPESFVIVTTRPHTVADINSQYKSHYAQVEILGLPLHSMYSFISRFFLVPLGYVDWVNRGTGIRTLPLNDPGVTEPPENQRAKAENVASLVAKLVHSDHLLQMCRYPMILTMLCFLWDEEQDLSLILTSLYFEAVVHVAKNRRDSIGEVEVTAIRRNVCGLLLKLGKVAFDGLLENKLLFKSQEFDPGILSEACEMGLVLKERRRSKLNPVDHITFLHRTFQDMSAAYYWASLVDSDEQLFCTYLNQFLCMRDNEMLLRFCCGASLKATKLILPVVVKISCIQKDQVEKSREKGETSPKKCLLGHPKRQLDPWRMPLLLLYEANCHNENLLELEKLHCLLDPLVSKMQVEANKNEAETELWAALRFLADKAQANRRLTTWFSHVKEVIIVDPSNTESSCVMGYSQFRRSETPTVARAVACMSDLRKLTLYGGSLQDCTSLFYSMARSQKATVCLNQLTCKSYSFKPQAMAEFLRCQSASSSLHIKGATGYMTEKTDPKEMSMVVDAVKLTPLKALILEDIALGQYVSCLKPLLLQLEELQLSRLYVDETNDCKVFFGMFSEVGEKLPLVKLSVAGNELSKAVDCFTEALKFLPDLQFLDLKHVDYKAPDCKVFFGMFSEVGEKLPLVKLSVAGNELSKAVDCFTEALKFLPDLQFLDLKHVDYKAPGRLEEQHFKVFGPALSLLPNLTTLILSGNIIGRSAREVGLGLQHLEKLQILKIMATGLKEESVPFLPFEGLQKLETLSIGGNKFGKGVKKVAEKLKSLHRLRNLEFSSAGLTDENVALLPLSSFPNLTSLDLSANAMWSDGLCIIAQQLKYMPNLESLHLEQNRDKGDEVMRGNRYRIGIEEVIRNLYHVPKMVNLWFPVDLGPEVWKKSELLTECVVRRIFKVAYEVPIHLGPRDIRNAICLVNAFNLAKVFQAQCLC